jgi:hypothetical protein
MMSVPVDANHRKADAEANDFGNQGAHINEVPDTRRQMQIQDQKRDRNGKHRIAEEGQSFELKGGDPFLVWFRHGRIIPGDPGDPKIALKTPAYASQPQASIFPTDLHCRYERVSRGAGSEGLMLSNGVSLPYSTYDKLGAIDQGTVVENKLSEGVLHSNVHTLTGI